VSGGMLNLVYFKRFDAADHMIGRSVDHVESDASPLRSSLANNKTCRTCHCHMKWTLKKKIAVMKSTECQTSGLKVT